MNLFICLDEVMLRWSLTRREIMWPIAVFRVNNFFYWILPTICVGCVSIYVCVSFTYTISSSSMIYIQSCVMLCNFIWGFRHRPLQITYNHFICVCVIYFFWHWNRIHISYCIQSLSYRLRWCWKKMSFEDCVHINT